MTRHGEKSHWFWAWLVLAVVRKRTRTVQNPRADVMLNLMLVRARSANEAIKKARALGEAEAGDDDGSLTLDGKPAQRIFLGIRNIGLLHDGVEDGAEILWDLRHSNLAAAKAMIATESRLRARLRREGVE